MLWPSQRAVEEDFELSDSVFFSRYMYLVRGSPAHGGTFPPTRNFPTLKLGREESFPWAASLYYFTAAKRGLPPDLSMLCAPLPLPPAAGEEGVSAGPGLSLLQVRDAGKGAGGGCRGVEAERSAEETGKGRAALVGG